MPFVARGRMRILLPGALAYHTTLAASIRQRPAPGRRTALFVDGLREARKTPAASSAAAAGAVHPP